MPLLNQPRNLFTHTGSEQDLASPAYAAIKAVYELIDGTQNFLSYVPGSLYNQFSHLLTGKTYILDLPSGSQGLYVPDGIALPDTGAADGASATLASIRALPQVPVNTRFYVTDDGKEGVFKVDPTDTITADNTGTVLVSQAGQRFTRVKGGPLLASQFGMIPNDKSAMATNAVILDRMIQLSPFSHIVMDGPGNSYCIGASPQPGLYPDSPFCIGLIDFQGTFECDHGVKLVTQTGYVGMQTARTTGESNVYLKNVSLAHDGGRDAVPHYRQNFTTNGDGSKNYLPYDWDQNWGNYKLNGLNMWGAGRMTNINIYGYPGHGMCVFGSTTISFPGPSYAVAGTFGTFNGDLTFQPDDPDYIFGKLGVTATWRFVCNGKDRGIGGAGNGSFSIGYTSNPGNTETPGQRGTGTVHLGGKSLFADSIVADGVNNIASVGGCGIFTAGNEANQSSFNFFRVGNCGGWGVADSSLLKNRFLDLHATACGEHFNDYSVSPPILRVGGFTNLGDPNFGSVLVGGYRESGQGLDQPYGSTIYLGGVYPEGVGGAGGKIIDNRLIGLISGHPNPEYGHTQVAFGEGLTFRKGQNNVLLDIDAQGRLTMNGQPIARA